jgi:hypothetical protein
MYRFSSAGLLISSGDSYSDQLVSGGIEQLSRIQSIELGLELPRQDIEFLDSNIQSVLIERPVVSLNYTYYPTNGENERLIGFFTNITGNAIKKLNQEKNYYISYLENSFDYNSYRELQPSVYKTLGLGNMLVDSWSISASVGDLVVANASLRGFNLVSYTGLPSGLESPTIKKTDGLEYGNLFSLPNGQPQYDILPLNPADGISALSAGDIIMRFPTGSAFATLMSGDKSCILQDFNFNVFIQRDQSQNLGEVFPARPIKFPLQISLETNAILQEYQAQKLIELNCNDVSHDVEIIMKQNCAYNSLLKLNLRKLRLKSQNMSQSLGGLGMVNVSFQWDGSVGSFGTGGAGFGLFASQGNQFYVLESFTDLSGIFAQEQIWKKEISQNQF